jgi:hypothetical protein
MRAAWAEHASPKPDGSPGYVVRFDPERRGFKSAMIAIVFCGMHIDALIYIRLRERFGRDSARKLDRKPHEERLNALGISEHELIARVVAFREARKDLVHEKAEDMEEISLTEIRTAQRVADQAISLMDEMRSALVAP